MIPPDDRPIALIGLMGSGKSAVARALGERLGTSVADLDTMIEAQEGGSVAELFERAGEPWFREREAQLLEQVLRAGVRVIACGGGVVVEGASRALLRLRCRVVWLEVEPAEAARRVLAESADAASVRPLLAGAPVEARLSELLALRTPWYADAAHLRVSTDGRTPMQVADAVVLALAART